MSTDPTVPQTPETRKAPTRPEQTRADAKAARDLAYIMERLDPNGAAQFDRLASCAEEWARLREGIEKLRDELHADGQRAAEPLKGNLLLWSGRLTALLAEGEMNTMAEEQVIRQGSRWRHKTRAAELGEAEIEWDSGTVVWRRMVKSGLVTLQKRTRFLENFEPVEEGE